jgi:sulfatase maturation enzyme AslB (radical SAM superfamily)
MTQIGLAVQNNGDFCVCNLNNKSFESASQDVLFVNKNTLTEAWDSRTRHEIGVDSCNACFDLERTGTKSQRQRYNLNLASVQPMGEQPRVLIVKPGNTCNLACRMCNAETSSGWYKDSFSLAQQDGYAGTIAEYTREFDHIRDGFSKHNTEFWETFTQWMDNIVQLDIYGGEPMLMPALFDSLSRVKNKDAHITLHTNGTIFNEDYLLTLREFRKVNLHISVDSDCAKELEYIRYPVVASTVFDNLNKYWEFFRGHKNVKTEITITVTPFNIQQIDRITVGLYKYNLPLSLNFVTSPAMYDVRNMPNKETVASNICVNKTAKNFLLQEATDSTAWDSFIVQTQKLDALRMQSYSQVFGAPGW